MRIDSQNQTRTVDVEPIDETGYIDVPPRPTEDEFDSLPVVELSEFSDVERVDA
jgi:hypothetical protein